MAPDTLTTLSNYLDQVSTFVVGHALVLAGVIAGVLIIYILGQTHRQAQRAERMEDAIAETEAVARQSHAAVQLFRNKLQQIEQRLDAERQQPRHPPAAAPEKKDDPQAAILQQQLTALQSELDG